MSSSKAKGKGPARDDDDDSGKNRKNKSVFGCISIPHLKGKRGKGRNEVREFTLLELREATKNFEEVLGKGGYAQVYIGILQNGEKIAVKKIKEWEEGGDQGEECSIKAENDRKEKDRKREEALQQFYNEVEVLSKLPHHLNIVRFIGECNEEGMYVVYELMSRSLDTLIFDKSKPMDFRTRMKIALGLAKAILHVRKNGYVHCDIKPANILLDENLNVKLADSGTAIMLKHKVSEIRIGTTGYNDPSQTINFKTDVYAFGVIMLQLISGRKSIDIFSSGEITNQNPQPQHIKFWAETLAAEGLYDKLADPLMRDKPAGQRFINFINFVLRCADVNPKLRPKSRKAVRQISSYLRFLGAENAGPST